MVSSAHRLKTFPTSPKAYLAFYGLLLTLLVGGGPASAQGPVSGDINVVVSRLEGPQLAKKQLNRLSKKLSSLSGAEIRSSIMMVKTSSFWSTARRLGVSAQLFDDATAMTRVADQLDIDVIMDLKLERATGSTWSQAWQDWMRLEGVPNRSRRDRVLRCALYSGRLGTIVEEVIVPVPGGRLTEEVWMVLYREVPPLLETVADAGDEVITPSRRVVRMAPETVSSHPVRRQRQPERANRNAVSTEDNLGTQPTNSEPEQDSEQLADNSWLSLSAGYASAQRTFSYDSQTIDNGIQYEAAFVPGFVLEATISPFASQSGFLSRISVGFLFEKIFLRSLVENELITGQIEKVLVTTTHDRARFQSRYTHRLDSGIEWFASLGAGQLRFLIDQNPSYRGVVYRYLELMTGIHLPLNGPAIAIEAEAGGMPLVSLGEYVSELGQEDATRGARGFLGLSSRIGLGERRGGRHHRTLVMRIGLNYTWFISGLAGPGRDGRIGISAEDRYLGIRAMVGLRF